MDQVHETWGRASLRAAVCSAGMLLIASSATALGGVVDCLPQDLDGSGDVDGADLGELLSVWGAKGGFGPADFDSSGFVDGADLGALLAQWGPVVPIDCVEIESVEPTSGAPGDIVKITGTFTEFDAGAYCCVVINDAGEVIPFEVLEVGPESMLVRVGPYAPGTGAGVIMVGMGDGTFATPTVPGAIFGGTPWSWAADGPGRMWDVAFGPAPAGAPIAGSFYGTLVGGDLCVTITGDCPSGTSFEIWPRAHHYGNGTPNDPYVGYDCYIPCVTIETDSTELDCANFLCATIEAVYLAHVPPIVIDCTVTTVGGGTKLTLSLPGLDIDWGVFNINVLPPNACQPPSPCNSACPCDVNGDGVVDNDDLIAIEMLFGTPCVPGTPCCADLNGDLKVDQFDIQYFFDNCVPDPCVPPPCNAACPCDVNGDGVVDQLDVLAIDVLLGTACVAGAPCCADLDGDGFITQADLQAFFDTCAPGPCVTNPCNADCPCDINNDGVVDGLDLAEILNAFGVPCDPVGGCCTDLNGDGITDLGDVAAWKACAGGCFP